MLTQVLPLLALVTILTTTGDAMPSNLTSHSTHESNSTCGQVTNVIVQGGVAGERGEMGPPGPQGLTGPAGPPGGGVVYTHWGRTTCPNTQGTEKVFDGLMAGSGYNEIGGSSNHLCIHTQPQFLATTPGVQSNRGYLYATDYRPHENPPALGHKLNHDTPCAVCYSSGRTATITIPGRTSCPSREYYGYLMSARHNYNARAPVCVDINAQSVPGSGANYYSSRLFFLETRCPGLCPPYSDGAEIACVVCTK